ncbi:MAG: phosphoglucosamine mutase [Haloferacaceae archaeon]
MFGTSGVRGPVGEAVTGDLALDVGRAVGSGADEVLVGRDARRSGEFLSAAVTAGLAECGADAVDCGRVATPTLARAVRRRGADAGVMVTASHNPPADNGLKLWTAAGRAFGTDRRERVTERVESGRFDAAAWDGTGRRVAATEPTERHRRALVAAGRERAADGADGADPLDGLSVVVDVGNGVGGVTADALVDLGAEVETLNANPDGRFPGRPSEPTAETCGSLCDAVARGADLGIAHDGDADRTMAVDERGRFVPGDALLATFALDATDPGGTVVAPVNASLAVEDALAARDVSLERTPVGDVHVAERAAAVGAAFGGEPSGAWLWPDEVPCPDGPLAAVVLAALVAREGPLAEAVDDFDAYPIRRESVETGRKDAVMGAVADLAAEEYGDVDRTDGVRVAVEDGWFLVRASGTQPLVRLTAEARSERRAHELLATARDLVERAA